MRRLAVIGSGISGLAVANSLAVEAAVTLFEAERWFGGHAHTVEVCLDGIAHGVDTGFLVFNERTYPQLVALFERLGVASAASEMSFSVQAPQAGWEWCGSDLNSVFAQRGNLVSPRFLGMLADVLRFNRLAAAMPAPRVGGLELRTGCRSRPRRGQCLPALPDQTPATPAVAGAGDRVEVQGVPAIAAVFGHMYHVLEIPRFVVHDIVADGDHCFLTWHFLFRFKRFAPGVDQVLRGATHLHFAADGRIVLHRDYWDAAEELYEKLPAVGTLMRWLKRRANA